MYSLDLKWFQFPVRLTILGCVSKGVSILEKKKVFFRNLIFVFGFYFGSGAQIKKMNKKKNTGIKNLPRTLNQKEWSVCWLVTLDSEAVGLSLSLVFWKTPSKPLWCFPWTVTIISWKPMRLKTGKKLANWNKKKYTGKNLLWIWN